VSIARALVLQPRLIVADEPVSMLDVSVRSGIMNLMLKLQADLGIAYLFITHDLAVARYMANRIAVMYLGVIVEEGPADTLISRAAHPYTRLLIAAVPEHGVGERRARVRLKGEAAAVKEIPSGCRFHPRCPMAQDVCRTQAPPAKQLADGHWSACHFAEQVATLDKLPAALH
jgi:oligopeptide/dipeptide ABC transporter ATP-binding protein